MRREIVCAGCSLDSASVDEGVPVPAAILGKTDEGWAATSNRLFSQDGSPVWICPACVEYLKKYIHSAAVEKRVEIEKWYIGELAKLTADYQKRKHDLEIKLTQDFDAIYDHTIRGS